MSVAVREARPSDVETVHGLILALAAYEKLDHEVEADAADLARALFAPAPRVSCDIAEWQGTPIGATLWFYSYSTFKGRHGIWLEDLFVQPDHRGRGAGKALLQALARRCLAEGLARFEWSVLDWNVSAIDFYRRQGAELMEGWRTCRVTGAALRALAERA